MKLAELVKDIRIIAASADMDTEISGISYDSRLTRPGDLFVAVKGLQVDGHKFIAKAMEMVAAACPEPLPARRKHLWSPARRRP